MTLLPPPEGHRLFGPDLIRATAIICVMLAHTIPGMTAFPIIGAIRGNLGYLGVEIFFVLSGYLIGGILLRQMFDGTLDSAGGLASFWKRRWFRTLPNYYLFLILFVLLAPYAEGAWPPAWRYFWFGQALMYPHPRFFTIAWSLAIEEWFYFSFPLLLWLMMKMCKRRIVSFGITVLCFLIFPPVLRYFATFDDVTDGLVKVTLYRLDTIMFGVILAFLHQRHPRCWSILRRAWPLGAATIIVLIAASHGTGSSFFSRVLFFSAFSLSLSLIFPRVVEVRHSEEKFTVPVRAISLWSYSMYLSHAWFGQFFATLFTVAGWPIHGANAVVLSALTWIATLIVSAFLYSYFEKPLMDLRDRPLRSILNLRRSKDVAGDARRP